MNTSERYDISLGVLGFCALIIGQLLCGCTSISLIDRADRKSEPKSMSITQFNEYVNGKPLTIRLHSGITYEAEDVFLSIDSTSFRVNDNGLRIRNDSIRYFLWRNHLGGAGEAFLLSIIPAVLLTQRISFADLGGSRIWPVTPAYVGVGVVTIASGIAGKAHYYRFSSDTDTSSNGD
jgi:hypothetical protein